MKARMLAEDAIGPGTVGMFTSHDKLLAEAQNY